MSDPGSSSDVVLESSTGRLIVATTVLGSALAMLTSTVVNVALPVLAVDLDASTSEQQWVINAYLLTLASLIVVGGGLGDRWGRVRVYRWGVVLFTGASVACAVAPHIEALVGFRLLQGIGAALLTPGSLAILEATLRPEDRGRAIGLWSGLGGIAAAIGPLVGGVLVQWSWRWVFLLNLPLAAVVLIMSRAIPETRDPTAREAPLDVAGAVLTAVALGGVSFGLIQGPSTDWGPLAIGAIVASGVALLALIVVERGNAHAILPLDLFADRTFLGANVLTFLVYAGLGIVFFMLSIQLQVGAGWSPLAAGASMLPVTALMMVLSPRAAEWASHRGPRGPLTLGPLIMAVGMLLMVRVDGEATFLVDVLPSMLVFGVGLGISVAPVTSTALEAVPEERAGAASGANSAIARTGQLLAVAAIPPLVGLQGRALSEADAVVAAFPTAIGIAAAAVALGGLSGWWFLGEAHPRS